MSLNQESEAGAEPFDGKSEKARGSVPLKRDNVSSHLLGYGRRTSDKEPAASGHFNPHQQIQILKWLRNFVSRGDFEKY